MVSDLDLLTGVLIIFVISLAVLFFLNIVVRNLGKIGRLELFLVIIIISFSLAYMLSLFNYQKSIPEVRDLKRVTDIDSIAHALDTFLDEHDYDGSIINTYPKCPNSQYIGSNDGLINLEGYLLGSHLSEMPYDPKAKDSKNTLYALCVNSALRIVISAPEGETRSIAVTK